MVATTEAPRCRAYYAINYEHSMLFSADFLRAKFVNGSYKTEVMYGYSKIAAGRVAWHLD